MQQVRGDLQKSLPAAEEHVADVPAVAAVGVDGCGAPVLALPLRSLAAAYLRLVSGEPQSLEETVASAML